MRAAPWIAETLEVAISRPPPPRSIMWRVAARKVKKTPSRLIPITRRQVSVGNSWNGAPPPAPAFAKQASTLPKCSTVSAKASSTRDSSETSQRSASTRVPCCSSCEAAAAFFSSLVPQMQMSAPDCARPSAMPRPIPLLPPVMSATFPLRSNGANGMWAVLLRCGCWGSLGWLRG